MKVTSVARFGLISVLSLAGSWVLVRAAELAGFWLPPVPWLVPGLLVILAATIAVLGYQVRRFLAGKNPTLDPLQAARTLVLAKAASYCGAVLLGWYGAQVIMEIDDFRAGQTEPLVMAAIATLAAILLGGVGLVVERWCRLPPRDEDGLEGAVPYSEPA